MVLLEGLDGLCVFLFEGGVECDGFEGGDGGEDVEGGGCDGCV